MTTLSPHQTFYTGILLGRDATMPFLGAIDVVNFSSQAEVADNLRDSAVALRAEGYAVLPNADIFKVTLNGDNELVETVDVSESV